MKLLLHRGSDVWSKLIGWQTRGPYSHASIEWSDGRGVEAYPGAGVRSVATGAYAPDERNGLCDVFWLSPKLAFDEQAAWNFAQAQIGKPYGWHTIAAFLTRDQAQRESSGNWICSELAFVLFQKAGIDLLTRIQPYEVSPNHLALSPLLSPLIFRFA